MSLNILGRPSLPSLLALLLLWSSLNALFGDYAKKKTSFEEVVERARELSEKPFKPAKSRLPKEFLDLDYDDYRKIVWNPENSLWREDNLNFRLEFFHPGYLFKTPVLIHEFSDSHVQSIPFTPEFFEYGDLELNPRKISRRAHYAGFRLLFPLNEEAKFDETLSFLGASYFRALGAGQRYGKSARALALDTGLDRPEEFPEFREFWIGKPEFDSTQVRIFALLDSPSVSGAYQFDVQPGKDTLIDVTSKLFFRNSLVWVGLAPLSSMYWYGENAVGHQPDFRPEVHDSDGLLIRTESETTWRALVNDGRKRNYVKQGADIRGFGLLQRDRDFDHYQDLEAWYQARPSVWIEIEKTAGPGTVQLIEFPTNNEFFDNIVAAWVPNELPEPGKPLSVSYRMSWTSRNVTPDSLARVVSTRFGKSLQGQAGTQFVVEFSRPEEHSGWDPSTVEASFAGSGSAGISDVRVIDNPLNSRWRVVFLVQGKEPADLACRLLHQGALVSEIWSYPWKPN